MELCPTLNMISYYFTKEIQVYPLRCFNNIILGIHKDKITSYNASIRALLQEQNIKLEKQKEEYQKSIKLAGN